MAVRRQATLYLPSPLSAIVESIRSRFNRAQFDLIRAHVTLCREDDVRDWDEFTSRINAVGTLEVNLEFGVPIRDNNLVYLPTIGSNKSYDTLRNMLLSTQSMWPRKHDPHITLIHPRNGICPDAVFDEITGRCKPFSSTFRYVTLIEQVDGGPWQDLNTYG